MPPSSKGKPKGLKLLGGNYIQKASTGTAPAAPWTPASLPNLKIWLEGDDVAVTSTSIDQFNDKSGNGEHFTSSSTARATVLSADLNSVNTARFDGTTDWYSGTTNQILAESTAHTVVIIAKHRGYDAAGDFDVVLNLRANANRCYQVWFTNQATYSEVAFGYANAGGTNNAIVRTTPTLGTTNYNCIIMNYNGSGDETTGNYTFEKNGAGATVNTGANATATYNNELGRWSSGSLFAKIDFALLIVMTSSISGTDRTKLETWITNKYGLVFT